MPLKLIKRGAVYHAHGTLAGREFRKSTGCRKRADAIAWAERIERETLERHALGLAATLTFHEAALAYLEAGGEGRFMAPILEYFGPDFRLAHLDNAALNQAAQALFPRAAPATINRCLITPVRAVVNLAAEDGLTPLRKFRTRREGPARTRWLRPAELDARLDCAGPHLRAILAAMIGTGARVSELLTAQAANFFPDTGQIWLDDTKSDFPRMLRMPGRARDLLQAAALPETGALLRRPDGAEYTLARGQSPFKTAFNRARDKAGLGPDVTPHVLRHTWATWFYAATRDFGSLMDIGGWRTPDMAQRYRKLAPDNLADDLAAHGWDFTRLGRALPPPGTAPVVLEAGAGGWACRWPQPGAAPADRLRLVN